MRNTLTAHHLVCTVHAIGMWCDNQVSELVDI